MANQNYSAYSTPKMDTSPRKYPSGFFREEDKKPTIFKEKRQSLARRLLRELLRFERQIRFIFLIPSFRKQKLQHDKHWSDRVVFSEGSRNLTKRAFIIVLFQPKGVSATTIESCMMMANAGYTVVAISNCPLTDSDAQELSKACWRYGSRPNYGYDAGAYRDAVKLLETQGGSFDEILLMNDSIMFPLGGDMTVLDDLRKLPDGFGGLILKTKTKGKHTRRPRWDDFVEAYFYRCQGRLLKPNGMFWWVWRTIWLTPGRDYLKEGLVSYILAFRGSPLITIASRKAFMEKIQVSSCAFLHTTLRYAAYHEKYLAERGRQLVKSWQGDNDEAWRERAVAHIEETVNLRQFHHSFIYASIMLFGLSFLKKSKGDKSSITVEAYLAAVDADELPPPTPLQRLELENPDNREAWGKFQSSAVSHQ